MVCRPLLRLLLLALGRLDPADDFRLRRLARHDQRGFLFLDHMDRQMKKLMEMTAKDPEWGELLRNGRLDVIKQRLDELVPLPPDK